jgi:hypothetical protein
MGKVSIEIRLPDLIDLIFYMLSPPNAEGPPFGDPSKSLPLYRPHVVACA